jgi:hypothetical protein
MMRISKVFPSIPGWDVVFKLWRSLGDDDDDDDNAVTCAWWSVHSHGNELLDGISHSHRVHPCYRF